VAEFVAVKCKTCGLPIIFDTPHPFDPNELVIYVPPLGDLRCANIDGPHSHQYGSDDVIVVRIEGVPG